MTQLQHGWQCARLAQPWARDALRLRFWDDQAKVAALRPPSDKFALAELATLMDWVAPRA